MATHDKEKPILFSGLMIRAILADMKDCTRRIIKPQPKWVADPSVPFKTDDADPNGIIKSRYAPGDTMWVRETWAQNDIDDLIWFRADGELQLGDDVEKWRPSIFMPRWACRIYLECTDVRAELLQEITDADAVHEGVENREAFRELWNTLNGFPKPVIKHGEITHYEAYPWSVEDFERMMGVGYVSLVSYRGHQLYVYANPWVWRYGFNVLSKAGRPQVKK